ncbi:MAG: DEAD/DEAH box helicase, partial [Lentisphaeria bacterium]|nr:DEAD/DEAH box helicase [Lentisphaeria bacterium]
KTVVHLNKLASAKWGKTRAAAARSVQALAYGMLRMQAVRKTVHTTPYPKDGLEQRMFEEAFPFRETADQLRAADEIKKDMEAARPMDRLLCGDVGFGKTELAMRAAFKAVSAGRQVAVLVPTTVLAQQHYYSFLERFAGTPVMIEQLSRFRTKGEQAEILRRLREGSLDIVIGTHRLVQEDVRFRDLGLIVIDEEQRFGVQHKERLKRLRVSADVLTMTATPIPRTLYMSMSGMRDLSTIMSAPVQRLPVRTVVAQSEENVIRNAISRELERDGQVYYLYNRVATIDEEAAKLQMMFPGARIGIGHGKMNEHELEDVMSRFIEGKMDILVCTTIIESGLDIPNANTIIIDRADRFGLAELYQLRGRVGRWTRQAYAYMLLPKSGILSGDARKRISAIRSYTHLGAGFKLAVRDLEIRGAGNILGAEQSGQIHAVGFHLYCELLRSCVTQLKGEALETPPQTDLFMDFLVFAGSPPEGKTGAAFTDDYINSPKLRIDAYRRLAAISTEARLDDFEKELRDRYGKLPPFAVNLLDCARIRLIASACGIESVTCRDDRVYLQLPDASFLKPGGMVPRLTPSFTPVKKLHQLLELLKEIRRKRK